MATDNPLSCKSYNEVIKCAKLGATFDVFVDSFNEMYGHNMYSTNYHKHDIPMTLKGLENRSVSRFTVRLFI